jgi:hypothetical protein
VADNATLVAGELVTIGVKQGHSSVGLLVEVRDGGVKVSVQYESVLIPFPLRAASADSCHRSTAIVHRLSRSWGFVRNDTRREVWAMVVDDDPAVPGGRRSDLPTRSERKEQTHV